MNKLYNCKLPNTDVNGKYNNVAIKMYNDLEKDPFIDWITTIISFILAAEHQLTPKVLGVFHGGIITEYFEV